MTSVLSFVHAMVESSRSTLTDLRFVLENFIRALKVACCLPDSFSSSAVTPSDFA